jgi:hexosaminidase
MKKRLNYFKVCLIKIPSMKNILWTLVIGSILLLGSCQKPTSMTEAGLIPLPQEVTNGSGSFQLTAESGIQLVGTSEKLTSIGESLATSLRPATGFKVPISKDSGNIVLELTGSDASEGYELVVSDQEVRIKASGEAGLFYGVQTLIQLFPAEISHQTVQDEDWILPQGKVVDTPEFAYRGSMLDVARHFISVEDVKFYIDQMAAMKFNYLHLHLTDDQGWRIEIKSWPKLTEIGSSTEVGGGKGGFYTQEEYKELVSYAAARFITIVPEVDMPGHTNSVLASYGELNPGVNLPIGQGLDSLNNKPLDYQLPFTAPQASQMYTGIEVGWSTFAPQLELTYAFVDSVVREISMLTPGPYFHIGGDESHVTEKEDYIYFVERVQDIVSKYNKTSMGWDEVATAKLLPGNVAQFWAKEENAMLAKNQGNKVLLSPAKKTYLDMQYDSLSRIGLHWAAYIELDSAYLWDPTTYVKGLAKEDILGVEAPLWSETVANRADINYLAFPRLAALAEVAWTKKEQRSWEGFSSRVPIQGDRWTIQGVDFYKSPTVEWVPKKASGFETLIVDFSNWIWGPPILILLLGGGTFFFIHSGFVPITKIGHAIELLKGKYEDKMAPGEITSKQALMSAIASTVGLGNISGVAIAINMGGPGALFWMWVAAFVGMATKFYTCSLSIMYRGKDSRGVIQGGPMYIIEHGMGKKWKFLSYIFCVAGVIGLLAVFTSNQLAAVIQAVLLEPETAVETTRNNWIIGIIMMVLTAVVILGGIQRIAAAASKMVPIMVGIYFIAVLIIIVQYFGNIPEVFQLIFVDAFTGNAAMGGAVGSVIIIGARRSLFSNEAGLGTAPMVHGQSKTNEPIREGLIAMLGPFIDTVVVCSLTAFAILLTGVWQNSENDGVKLTLEAFELGIPVIGKYLLMISALVFALSTMFTYSYYGQKCASYLFGAKVAGYYNYIYLIMIVVGAVASLDLVVSLVDGMYAVMAFPNMIAALYLAPKVKAAAKDYFARMKQA